MTDILAFHAIGRLPLPGDNVAVATQRLPAGTRFDYNGAIYTLNYTVMEGHRFAVQPIAAGTWLLSWNLPFGVALRDIAPGEYVANEEMLHALHGRTIDFALPPEANFADHIEPYVLDEANFQSADQVSRYTEDRTFLGYRRPGGRGVGTRNMVVLLGTSSRTGGFVKQLEARLAGAAGDYENIDGIVAVAHTEGGHEDPNNLEFVLRTLAGFMVHPNVGAVLAVDYGLEPVTNEMVRQYLVDHGYPIEHVLHRFLSITDGFAATMADAEATVRGWLDEVNATGRTEESLAQLKIALQCGGSDAFSGISGNPLGSWVAREVIRYGGAANLAETDELIGAEPYVLQKVRDVATARRFLETLDRFGQRAAWHGASAAGNPSGGNKYRGLYNIVLKSIGAAMKRHPDVRLDYVIDYGEPMTEPGYYFMDSPGNDLESIAGQIASGCNLIFFITGNGSVTNFPFVPTVKIVTTTRRYQLLSREMDVNAGKYLDGVSMDDLGAEMLELTIDIASGQRSVGEKAGHAQVQLWRDWRQTDESNLERLLHAPQPAGRPLPLAPGHLPVLTPSRPLSLLPTDAGPVSDRIGLLLPTSLCAGQVARMIANHFNQKALGQDHGISRFVALAHTEGCGVSGGTSEQLYVRTLLGYLRHPLVAHCLLLEHGCEKTHNDFIRHEIVRWGLDEEAFGWASIQLDGGIDAVMAKSEAWFGKRLAQEQPGERKPADLSALRVGLMNAGAVSDVAQRALARLSAVIAGAGGTLIVPENSALLSSADYLATTIGAATLPTLAYGQSLHTAQAGGFHIMEAPTGHWTETLTGLGATGVEVVLVYAGEHPIQGHPLLPVVQVTAEERVEQHFAADMDLILGGEPDGWAQDLLDLIVDVLSRRYLPRTTQIGNIDFQFTRGLLGVSL